MLNLRIRTLVAPVLLAAGLVLPALGQVARERITFTISGPFALKKSDVVLPAGKYTLAQEEIGEGSAFALYSELWKKPLAVLDTVSLFDDFSTPIPEKTEIVLDNAKVPEGGVPVLEGWKVPGGDEWQVVNVVPDKKGIARIGQQQIGSPAQRGQ